jgi:tetratricopeptide (TPR) repeat protein
MKLGDASEAKSYLDLVLVAQPRLRPAVALLAELYGETRQWKRAVETLERLAAATDEPAARAALLYRMGEIYQLELGDSERASDLYLKAIDLDPHSVPIMRRLIDYYWAEPDLPSVDELARELEATGALYSSETSAETMARAGTAAALAGDVARAARAGGALGAAGAGPLVMAIAQAAHYADAPLLAAAARTLCGAPGGPSLVAVRGMLVARARKDRRIASVVDVM